MSDIDVIKSKLEQDFMDKFGLKKLSMTEKFMCSCAAKDIADGKDVEIVDEINWRGFKVVKK